jgi:type VI secretion system protein ImpI
MPLTLAIENETSLPDGGPLSVTIQGQRGIDIGRDTHLDWTLPDPTRFISGKHCEVRYRDGSYWLHDVSTNGTFLYGSDHRMQAPHRLRSGDRFVIGNYVVAATIDGDAESAAPACTDGAAAAPSRARDDQALWANEGELAPPINAKELKPPERRAPVRPDFLDWAADIPAPLPAVPETRASAPADRPTRSTADAKVDPDMDWASGPPSRTPTPQPAAAPMPTPRRPAPAARPPSLWDESASGEPVSAPSAARPPAAEAMAAAASPTFAPTAGAIGSPDAFLRQLARSAGLPEDLLTRADATELAQQLGCVLRSVTGNLMQLLNARAQSKQLARSASHTMVQAIGNNPLKFAPSAEDAMRIMFGPPTQSYLDAQRAVEQSFADLKRHHIMTYAAMQHALGMLMADLGPRAIEASTSDDSGLASLLASRKAKLWDAYVTRWQAKVRADERGPIEAFMLHFAEYYDRDSDGRPRSAPQSQQSQQSQPQTTHTADDDALAQ